MDQRLDRPDRTRGTATAKQVPVTGHCSGQGPDHCSGRRPMCGTSRDTPSPRIRGGRGVSGQMVGRASLAAIAAATKSTLRATSGRRRGGPDMVMERTGAGGGATERASQA